MEGVTIHQGDSLTVLRELPDESVDCVITSPPYFALRDYGTGTWEGGDKACDHVDPTGGRKDAATLGEYDRRVGHATGAVDERVARRHAGKGLAQYRRTCGKCGATRVDKQIGLEQTPAEYVARLVEVFREVRRVLSRHGTMWLVLGDSYNTSASGRGNASSSTLEGTPNSLNPASTRRVKQLYSGLKPKDLMGIPWRVALALQEDGWYLRSDIVWHKPNPMPESVRDRPTKSHEYVFLLTREPRYYFDADAVREGFADGRNGASGQKSSKFQDMGARGRGDGGVTRAPQTSGRNIRSVWKIATTPYKGAHFAVFPPKLVERCLLAGCPEWVCGECGEPRRRVVERREIPRTRPAYNGKGRVDGNGIHARTTPPAGGSSLAGYVFQTSGFTDCGHDDYRPGVVLDPFFGAGTTAVVARSLGRHAVGIELNPEYIALAEERIRGSLQAA